MDGLAWAGDLAWETAAASWAMLREAGIFVLAGLAAAGLVHVFVSRAFLTRHLGGRGLGSVLKAALVGAPLPLCSCSVLPTALALRERGAGRGATVSFLISTPETGVDSIAITWALMGPLMAIVRPVAAVLTAVAAGMAEALHSRRLPDAPPAPFGCQICQSDSCEHVGPQGRWGRFWRFVLLGMGDDLGPTLALGLVLAGLATAVVPDDFFARYLGNHWVAMLVMLAVGLPLYVCASASTPLAAALVLTKGLSPGAALVFLLVGPATNLTTILVVARMLGKASAAIYVLTIAAMSLACGALLDAATGALDVRVVPSGAGEHVPAWVLTAGAVVLAAYLALALGRWARRRLRRKAPAAAEGTGGLAASGQATAGLPCQGGTRAASAGPCADDCRAPAVGDGCGCEHPERPDVPGRRVP